MEEGSGVPRGKKSSGKDRDGNVRDRKSTSHSKTEGELDPRKVSGRPQERSRGAKAFQEV